MNQEIGWKEYRRLVCAKVVKSIGDEPWFRGVCTDTIKDSYNDGASIEEAAELAESDTYQWDYRDGHLRD